MKNKDIKRPPSEAETIKDDISDVEVVVTGMDTDFLKTGYILNNRFVIKKSLGKGGMGVVYHAWDEELEQDVAIKLIRGDIISGIIIDRLKREIKLARKIGHKGIARVYDIGDHKGFKYISMELIHGETLHDIIQKKKRLSLKEFLDYAIQITDAINAAHEENIVHRDLKPGNIMISEDGTVKVLDFGLAYSPEEKKITRTDAMMGTMEYISPEQAEGKTPTAQSDIYSLSVIFFNMITGNLPYQGDSPIATAMKHITEKVPAPSSFIKDIPVELEEIIIKGMQKKPKDRFRDCRELLAELKKLEGLVTEGKTGRLSIVRLIKKPLFAASLAILLILAALYFVVLKPAPVDSSDISMDITVIGERMDLMGNVMEVMVKNGETLYSNDGFQIHISAGSNAYIYVIDLDSKGKVELLFPRPEINLPHRFEANRSYILPGEKLWYRLDDTRGVENIFIISSKEPQERIDQLIAQLGKLDVDEKLTPAFDLMAEMKIIERGIKGVDTGRISRYQLSKGTVVQKASEIIKGSGAVVKSISFVHK